MATKKTSSKKSKTPNAEPISKELFNVLACPQCKGDLNYNPSKTALLCAKCKETFAIKEGIPILLPKSLR